MPCCIIKPGGVGPVRGQFTVPVDIAHRILLRVQGQFVGQLAEVLRQSNQQVRAIRAYLGTAAIEKSVGGGLGKLYAQVFVSNRHVDVAFQFLEIGNLANRLLQLLLNCSMLSFVTTKFSAAPLMSVPTFLAVPVGSLKYPPTASLTCWLLFKSHKTMNSAIMAVTKSA